MMAAAAIVSEAFVDIYGENVKKKKSKSDRKRSETKIIKCVFFIYKEMFIIDKQNNKEWSKTCWSVGTLY